MDTKELEFTGELRRGSAGLGVQRVQEWLCLHNLGLVIDGMTDPNPYGPRTEKRVRQFQSLRGITETGVVDEETFAALTKPLRDALAFTPFGDGTSLAQLFLDVARQHLVAKPREVGGENAGPWVRYYMHGADGPKQHWCAGSVTSMLLQAAELLDVISPIQYHINCNRLHDTARDAGRLVRGADTDKSRLFPACIFLVKSKAGGYNHTGLAWNLDDDGCDTIEGNFTGARGGGMYAYSRAHTSLDYIALD